MNREDFLMLKKDIIFFDSAATSFKPKCVVDKISDYYNNYCANAHRGDYDISYQVDVAIDETRNKVKEFINAKSIEEIVFTSGTTDSLNMIVDGFFSNYLENGDEILITTSEHASNVLPWYRLQKNLGIIVKFIPLDDDNYVTLENVKKSITPKTKVISMAIVTNVIGDKRPTKEITKLAHDNNIFVVADAAQSIAHSKTDVIDLDVDFMAFSAHKMCGPTGVGILYGKKELLENMEPLRLGGGMNENFSMNGDTTLKGLPYRLEAGTINIADIIAYQESIKYLEKIGMDVINQYEQELRTYLLEKLIKIPHIDIINLESDSGIVTISINDIFSQDVAYYLNKYNICVRAGNHCAKMLKNNIGITNTVRISLYFYNTFEELDMLVDLLKDKEKILKEMI